jgi:hypothetical protein
MPPVTFFAARPRGLRPQASAGPNLHVDWRRYNQQILFVDGSDTIRGRLATGFLERTSEWNGAARILVAYHCGLHATPGTQAKVCAEPSAATTPIEDPRGRRRAQT